MGGLSLNIIMAGIDHAAAGIDTRERFSFTKTAAEAAMNQLRQNHIAQGCVILSTCNRTEFWLSGASEEVNPASLLCNLKGLEPEAYQKYLTVRKDEEAVRHLFRTACGMNSQLFGEDQIITQVGEAGDFARGCGGSDTALDTLFRTAVTAAKKVKTEVRLTAVRRSAAESTLELLQKELSPLKEKTALVIGNGAMGNLAAQTLLSAGMRVFMTLRQYKYGGATVPEGCIAIHYEERARYMDGADVIVSATASPHFTVRGEMAAGLSERPRIFIDLAVPRDIDPEVAKVSGARVWDIDQLGAAGPDADNTAAAERAEAILKEYLEEYRSWYYFRDAVPLIRQISRRAAEDMLKRMEKTMHTLPLAAEQKEQLQEQIDHHAEKTVAHLLFGLRETLSPELLQACLTALNQV